MSVKSASRNRWVIGVDDTDMPSQGGTGQLARSLAAEIHERGLGTPVGVTRHQLFEGPGVPKTSRNSAAAIEFAESGSAAELFSVVGEIVERDSIEGSDPGIALAPPDSRPSLSAFAMATQIRLVTQQRAHRVAEQEGVILAGLGGDSGGVIGALAAVGLRVDGNDGRFVGLDGIRDVGGPTSVRDFLEQTDVVAVIDESTGDRLRTDLVVDLGDWVRPRLIDGQPILMARSNGERWLNADARPH